MTGLRAIFYLALTLLISCWTCSALKSDCSAVPVDQNFKTCCNIPELFPRSALNNSLTEEDCVSFFHHNN